jgi:hypothetical protein
MIWVNGNIFDKKTPSWAGGMAQVVECLSSNTSTTKKEKRKEKETPS